MNEILNINKPLGITSYDVIRMLKKKYPGEKIGHAGTLDPLASGVLICLIGKDATKRQSEFMNVDKDYEFDVLFGFETDTYDVLGLVKEVGIYDCDVLVQKVKGLVNGLSGDLDQPVPSFSAVKISGKPLYRWYLENRINEVEIPIKQVHIDSIDIQNVEIISKADIEVRILNVLDTVKSGFRQNSIVSGWKNVLKKVKQDKFLVVRIRSTVSKGTYVRAIAHKLGQDAKVGACTITIKRTRVAGFSILESKNPPTISPSPIST